jgi:hypothetical protein
MTTAEFRKGGRVCRNGGSVVLLVACAGAPTAPKALPKLAQH